MYWYARNGHDAAAQYTTGREENESRLTPYYGSMSEGLSTRQSMKNDGCTAVVGEADVCGQRSVGTDTQAGESQ